MPPNNQATGSSQPNNQMPPPSGVPQTVPAPPQQQSIGSGQGGQQQQPKPKNPNSAQNSLLVSELREGMAIMTDGSFRAVVACKSINFDLMSASEREAVEYSYQNFLNSLNHPIQILVKSQKVDIGPYIDRLSELRRSQDNMLLGVLMDDYIDFIDSIAQEANIMDKSFFIVIPYYPNGGEGENIIKQSKGFFNKLFSKPKNTITRIDAATYQKAKDEISNRVAGVTSGLYQIGVQAVQLDTKQLGELFYNAYNPDTSVRQPLSNFNDITSTYVRKSPGTKGPGVAKNG